MANEIVPSGIGDLISSEVLAAEYLLLLADRDASVLTHPAFFHATGAPGSNVVQVSHLGMGYDLMSADTPGSEHSNTAFSDGSTDVTLANYVLRYNMHDLARYMANGKLDPALFAMFAMVNISQTLISLAANVGDGFTNIAGTSGADASWDDILVAKAYLGVAKANGRICGLLHPQQWADLETDALSLGVLPSQTNAAIVNSGLDAYKGTFFGVDFFTSSAVPASGGNRLGCLFTSGGIVWADAAYTNDGDPNIADLGGRGQVERVRQGHFSSTSIVIRSAMGVALGIDGSGVTLRTDQ